MTKNILEAEEKLLKKYESDGNVNVGKDATLLELFLLNKNLTRNDVLVMMNDLFAAGIDTVSRKT